MKAFLSILLYLVCSECRIEDSYVEPKEQIPYNILSRVEAGYDMKINFNPLVIKDLSDYNNFYLNYYGTTPGYVDFDFTEYMMVVVLASNVTHGIDITEVYQTHDEIVIRTYRGSQKDFEGYYGSWDPKNTMISISMKRSDKMIRVV